ncbi:MAG: hypothetical protein HUU38_31240, partial [Anaerolineales bacterium]|nr:hypothetical protein [Anaerolineales bacterium]
MATIFYLLMTLILLGMYFYLWRFRKNLEERQVGVLVLQGVLFGLIYDGLVLILGNWLGEGDLLRRLNLGRYLAFAGLTPLLMISGMSIVARAEVPWTQKKVFQGIIWLATLSLIGFGGALEWQFKDDLMVESSAGVLRYVHEGGYLPFAPILTTLVLCILGVLLWRKIGWPWVFVGGVVMFVGSAFPPGFVGPWIGSGVQVVLMGCLVATEKRLLTINKVQLESELESRINQAT